MSLKVGEVEKDSDLYYIYKIDNDEYYCICQNKSDGTMSDSCYDSDSMNIGSIVRKIVPDNKLSRLMYPEGVPVNNKLVTYPEGNSDMIEKFILRCKEYIKEEGLK